MVHVITFVVLYVPVNFVGYVCEKWIICILLPPTGCTFYGKQRWSKGKSILFLILLWIFTPILAILLIVITFPILLFILPIIITRKFYRYSLETDLGCCCRTLSIFLIFILSVLITPLLLVLLVIVGIPIVLFFVYLYMPKRYISANF